ncbi:hypothetical protein C8R46DRAFT_1029370 [Mycena filopes]|nr:hypothetical protein C8R46DRAFT_1029370 [Mycena filopes]
MYSITKGSCEKHRIRVPILRLTYAIVSAFRFDIYRPNSVALFSLGGTNERREGVADKTRNWAAARQVEAGWIMSAATADRAKDAEGTLAEVLPMVEARFRRDGAFQSVKVIEKPILKGLANVWRDADAARQVSAKPVEPRRKQSLSENHLGSSHSTVSWMLLNVTQIAQRETNQQQSTKKRGKRLNNTTQQTSGSPILHNL